MMHPYQSGTEVLLLSDTINLCRHEKKFFLYFVKTRLVSLKRLNSRLLLDFRKLLTTQKMLFVLFLVEQFSSRMRTNCWVHLLFVVRIFIPRSTGFLEVEKKNPIWLHSSVLEVERLQYKY